MAVTACCNVILASHCPQHRAGEMHEDRQGQHLFDVKSTSALSHKFGSEAVSNCLEHPVIWHMPTSIGVRLEHSLAKILLSICRDVGR